MSYHIKSKCFLNRAHHKRNPHHYSVSYKYIAKGEVGVFNEDPFLTWQYNENRRQSAARAVIQIADGRGKRLGLMSEIVSTHPRYGRRCRRDRRCLYDLLPRQRAQPPIGFIIVPSICQQKLCGSPLRRKAE